jgi:hypothetical protein
MSEAHFTDNPLEDRPYTFTVTVMSADSYVEANMILAEWAGRSDRNVNFDPNVVVSMPVMGERVEVPDFIEGG